MFALHQLLLVPLLIGMGCAAQPVAGPATRHRSAAASIPASDGDPKAALSLEQILPVPVLPKATPTTEPSDPPPLQAVHLFAQGRIALLDDRPTEAAQLLSKAVALDPNSFELLRALGDAYAAASDPRATTPREQALAIEPDRLDLRIDVARQYLARDQADKATQQLRLALQTTEYRESYPAAAGADFLLARSLQLQGYDHAALQMYERLLGRLRNPGMALRLNPQVAFLLAHPDALALDIAALYEKHREYAAAVTLLGPTARRAPGNFPLQSRLAMDTARAGRISEATGMAATLVGRWHASRDSVELLRDVAGNARAIRELRKLHADHPADRDIVYALADVLSIAHRLPESRRVLDDAATQWPDDLRLLRLRVRLLSASGELPAAAKLLIGWLSSHPDRELEVIPVWDSLLRPSPQGRLRPGDVAALKVPATDEPAKLILLARAAQSVHQNALDREALRKAVAIRPIFAPAWREMLAVIWSEETKPVAQKRQASEQLQAAAREAGNSAFADELHGHALLNDHDPAKASLAFANAGAGGDRSAELYLNLAASLLAAGDASHAQSLLWKLISDHPLAEEPYLALHAIYEKAAKLDQAHRVLQVWLENDPDSPGAGRLAAREEFDARQFVAAEQELLDLLDHHDTDPQVIVAVQQFFSQTMRLTELADLLGKRLAREPWNFLIESALVETYVEEHRPTDAAKVLDKTVAAFAADPDVLYRIAALYASLGRVEQSERTLRQVLAREPDFAAANNDLAYSEADRGINLSEAEQLVRRALRVEPDNASFLDSLGWVLYKLGKFQEAMANLAKAADPPDMADPVTLNHLGDVYYRLGDRARAADEWRLASQRIPGSAEDDEGEMKQLRLQLIKKQQEVKEGGPVSVAPLGKEPKQ